MLELLEKLRKEKDAIAAAPWTFVMVTAIVVAITYGLFQAIYSVKLSNAKELTEHWKGESEQWKSQADLWKEKASQVVKCPPNSPKPTAGTTPTSPTPQRPQRTVERIPTKAEPVQPAASPAPVPTTTNNAPNGFAISGGQVFHPEVHNNRNPLPEINWAPHTMPAYGEKDPMNRTTASVSVVLKGTFYNPAFIATCSVQCEFVENGTLTGNAILFRNPGQALGSKDFMKAGVAMSDNQLMSGSVVILVFRSTQPGALLKITDVQPYAPEH